MTPPSFEKRKGYVVVVFEVYNNSCYKSVTSGGCSLWWLWASLWCFGLDKEALLASFILSLSSASSHFTQHQNNSVPRRENVILTLVSFSFVNDINDSPLCHLYVCIVLFLPSLGQYSLCTLTMKTKKKSYLTFVWTLQTKNPRTFYPLQYPFNKLLS